MSPKAPELNNRAAGRRCSDAAVEFGRLRAAGTPAVVREFGVVLRCG
jgi:hypothetical protein